MSILSVKVAIQEKLQERKLELPRMTLSRLMGRRVEDMQTLGQLKIEDKTSLRLSLSLAPSFNPFSSSPLHAVEIKDEH